MDLFDLAAKVLGIISPIVSIIEVVVTKSKKGNESQVNIVHKKKRIVFRPIITVKKNYINNYTSTNGTVLSNAERNLKTNNVRDSDIFVLIIAAILFMLIAFVILKKIKQLIIMFLLALSVITIAISLIHIKKYPNLLEEKSVTSHLILCIAGTVLPALSHYQFYQPMPFDIFYAKLFPSDIGGLSNIISNMMIQSVKLLKPTYYYLFIFFGLIAIAMYEFVMFIKSVKFSKNNYVSEHKLVLGLVLFIGCSLTATGITYKILYLAILKISSFISWISSPSFHLS